MDAGGAVALPAAPNGASSDGECLSSGPCAGGAPTLAVKGGAAPVVVVVVPPVGTRYTTTRSTTIDLTVEAAGGGHDDEEEEEDGFAGGGAVVPGSTVVGPPPPPAWSTPFCCGFVFIGPVLVVERPAAAAGGTRMRSLYVSTRVASLAPRLTTSER